MKKNLLKIIVFLALLVPSFVIRASSVVEVEKPSTQAVKDLINRITPNYGDQFVLEYMDADHQKDVFEVDKKGDKILLRGNNNISLALAFNHYLKEVAHCSLSWCGDQLNLPEKLVLPPKKYRQVIDQKYRFYFNYCTLSYSAAWWHWDRWQREIDFMAMNGVNMPLAVIGIEGAWYNTLLRLGYTDLEAREFLVGPAYFAWQWMNNIQSFGGPLPKSWIDSHVELGQQIMQRYLELGMHPVQQGFSGYVPRSFMRKFPEAAVSKEGSWCGFEGTAQLDPTDTIFKKIGLIFLDEQKKLFGAHHFYAADPFHEGRPPRPGDAYLNEVGRAIGGLLHDFDPQYTWVNQAWSIRKAIVDVESKKRLLVLDLTGSACENQAKYGFWGYDFIEGNLHNFGGRINMHGDMQAIADNKYRKAKQKMPNAIGTGLFMEAIGDNPVYYDLVFDMLTRSDSVIPEEWIKGLIQRRYGHFSEPAYQSWLVTLHSAYGKGTNDVENSSIICARPAIDCRKSGPNAPLHIPYNPMDLVRAQDLLMQDSSLYAADGFKYDVVNLQRQILSNLAQEIHKKVAAAYLAKDKDAFTLQSKRFLSLFDDLDQLLSTRPEFSFDKWIADARSWGTTEEEKRLYEYNASMLVTQWGPDDSPRIFDYGWKEWSGLIKGYYKMRWTKFYTMLGESLNTGIPYQEAGLPKAFDYPSYRANTFYDQLGDWEHDWIHSQKKLSLTLEYPELQVVKRIMAKYRPFYKEYYEGKTYDGKPILSKNDYINFGEHKK